MSPSTYLQTYAPLAPDFLAARTDLLDYHRFIQQFFEAEHLVNLTWPAVQALGKYIHAFQSNSLARSRALGRPNHDVNHYRRSFEYFVRGDDDLATRINKLKSNSEYGLFGFGESVLGELAGQLFADTYTLMNRRSRWAAEELGCLDSDDEPRRLGDRFVWFTEQTSAIADEYVSIVGRQMNDVPLRLELDQFFSWMYKNYQESTAAAHSSPRTPTPFQTVHKARTWLIALGRDGEKWPECRDKGLIAIGWDELGNLSRYSSRDAITTALAATTEGTVKPTNNSLACWQFANDISPGDLIFVRQGRDTVLGVGTVQSKYSFDESRANYKHVRNVEWLLTGNWTLADTQRTKPMNVKTLTEISPYGNLLTTLKQLTGYDSIQRAPLDAHQPSVAHDSDSVERPCWWLNCNPGYWDIRSVPVGEEQSYTAINENGNKRSKYEYFHAVQPGDMMIGYATTPAKRVAAICEVVRGIDPDAEVEEILFRKIEDLPDGPTWQTLQNSASLATAEPIQHNQGSLFRLTTEEFRVIARMAGAINYVADQPKATAPYTLEDALEDVFVDPIEFGNWLALLRTRKNLILQGPPGVGKTFLARRIAKALTGRADGHSVEMVQFHQSYGYEDFVQGYRPDPKGGFALKHGVFYEFVLRAAKQPDVPHVFIIDEVNRGNLSKILGETMMLIERDKRGKSYAIKLANSAAEDDTFYVPDNVHLLGLMNTADRSLAVVDYALRRRFTFVTVTPQLDSLALSEFLEEGGADTAFAGAIIGAVNHVNTQLASDIELGPGYCIGHSYLCPLVGTTLDRAWWDEVVRYELGPLLESYYFDRPQLAKDLIAPLEKLAAA